jgi:hypothetical protein
MTLSGKINVITQVITLSSSQIMTPNIQPDDNINVIIQPDDYTKRFGQYHHPAI